MSHHLLSTILSDELVIARSGGQFVLRSMPGTDAQEDIIAAEAWTEFVEMCYEQFRMTPPPDELPAEIFYGNEQAFKGEIVRRMKGAVNELQELGNMLPNIGINVEYDVTKNETMSGRGGTVAADILTIHLKENL